MRWQYKLGIVVLLGIAGLSIEIEYLANRFQTMFWIAPTITAVAGATYILFLGLEEAKELPK